jgi:alkylation response protein AidB-like acyl-CoA dehydrogenase
LPRRVPDRAALIAGARALIPRLRARGAAADAARCLPAETVAELSVLGVFRVVRPIAHGGWGMRPSVLWEMTREIGRGCGSTAWIAGLLGLHPWVGGLFGAAARAELFAGDAELVMPVLSGGVARETRVIERADGYELSGRWLYGSAIDIANWVALVFVHREAQFFAVVPQREFRVARDTWNVLGMQATGSMDVSLDAAFVPRHRVISWTEAQAGRFSDPVESPMNRMPLNALFAFSTAAPLCGLAQQAVDLVRETMLSRRVAGVAQAEDRVTQAALGRCAAEIGMAKRLLLGDVDEMYDRAVAGEPFDTESRARYRMDAALVGRTVLDAGRHALDLVGGAILPQASPIARCLRDLNVMATHFLLQVEGPAELYGRALLGQPMLPGARL